MKTTLRYVFIAGLFCSVVLSCKKEPTSTTDSSNTGTTTGKDTSKNTGTGAATGTGTSTGTTTNTGLSIIDFEPKTAKPASQITITGTGFGINLYNVNVLIGNAPYLDIVSVTPTTIVIKTNLLTASGKIAVKVGGITVNSTNDFTAQLEDLNIYNFKGGAGQAGSVQLGQQVYVSSTGLGKDTSKMFLSFGGTKAVKVNYLSPSGNITGAIVPRYALPGKVTLTVDTRTTTSTIDLKFDMSLRDFTPKTFGAGDTVKITGVSFTVNGATSVDFNDNKAIKPFKATDTEMSIIVPSDAKSGYLKVANVGGDEDFIYDDAHKFTFIPTVYFNNGLTFSSGRVNDVISIQGDFVGADITKMGVSFGGSKPVQPQSILGAVLSVKIPADAKTGGITISRLGYRPFTAPFIFTIVP